MSTAAEDRRIQPALDAFLAGDTEALRAVIAADPEIIGVRWNGNTLVEWATQPPHGISPAIVEALIDGGSDLDRALNLAGCWNQPDLCRQLLAAGADPTARADANITPLESAAMHGSTDSADVLIGHGLHRPSLWLAAASGSLEVVSGWLDQNGRLLKDAGSYRPNWADVDRSPGAPATDDPTEIVGEALVLAAANGRAEVVDYLLSAGADIDARPYRNTTGLHLAIQFAKPSMVEHLLHLGASFTIEDDEHNADARRWAEVCNDGSPAAEQIETLLANYDPPAAPAPTRLTEGP